jgi:toxin-antitoxin system PIN domain toxin
MLVVDTNILIYAADRRSPFHLACKDWLDRQRRRPEAWYATWSILYEFLRVTTHARLSPHAWKLQTAWDFVRALLASPGFGVLVHTERHADIAAATFAEFPELAGNVLHDVHTIVLMREHGISRICTRDAEFHRFPFLQVIDPLRG